MRRRSSNSICLIQVISKTITNLQHTWMIKALDLDLLSNACGFDADKHPCFVYFRRMRCWTHRPRDPVVLLLLLVVVALSCTVSGVSGNVVGPGTKLKMYEGVSTAETNQCAGKTLDRIPKSVSILDMRRKILFLVNVALENEIRFHVIVLTLHKKRDTH